MILASDPMAVLAAVHDVWLARGTIERDGRQSPVLFCDSCGCVFWPSYDGDWDCVYPDRYSFIGSGGSQCSTPCRCHNFPYCTDDGGGLDVGDVEDSDRLRAEEQAEQEQNRKRLAKMASIAAS